MSSVRATMLSLGTALGVPSTKIPINMATLVSYIIPPVICYFFVAVLAITPQTRLIRVAVWPIVALLTLRAALSVDLSLGIPERKYLNIDLVLAMFSIATRTMHWSFAKEPLVRHLRPANSSPSVIMDALDLVTNLRGHGWEWSRGLHIPDDPRPTNRIAFVFYTLFSAAVHTLICGTLHRAVLTLAPAGSESSLNKWSIFDESLPFLARYFRASISTICAGFAVYGVMQMNYDLCTLPPILFLGQDPAQWPPAFDAPWRATSLSDFWGRRWHQWFRHTFLLLGGHPLSVLFGRAGMIVGAFFVSAIFHHLTTLTFDGQAEFWRMLVAFGMMAPGILAERAFYRLTGKKVCGVVGWIWTMTWLLLWGSFMIDGFARTGILGSSSLIDSALPVRGLVERWATAFDAWLHTM